MPFMLDEVIGVSKPVVLSLPILPPFNPALLVVLIPGHKIISLLLPSWAKFATVLNHNANSLLCRIDDM